jgi:hypothetical protein
MSVMNIDFRLVKTWLGEWEKDSQAYRTASQIAAVMLNKMREESETRLSRLERLMKDIFKENHILQQLEQKFISLFKSNHGLDRKVETELKEHRRRMITIMKEADEVLREPRSDRSVKAGGLLLEINCQEPGSDSVQAP